MKRAAQITLSILFLATIYSVPVGQVLVEKLERDERPGVLALFGRAPSEPNLRAFERELEEASAVAQRVRPLFQLGRYVTLGDLGEKAVRGRNGWLYYHPEVRYLGEPYFRALRAEDRPVGDPADAIVDFAAQLRARGAELLVVPVPSKPSVYPELLARGPRPGPALATHTLRFIGELRRRGVDVLELHRVFLGARSTHPRGPSLYMASDTHWTGDGLRLAARAIAAHVRATRWYGALPSQAHRRYTIQPVTIARQGDIPRMTQIPDLERLFGRELVACARVLDANGQAYEDADSSPILLLGDSFSRIFQSDEPEAAGLIAHLARELELPLASIVNDGGASTLVRQELARDPGQLEGKKLVIWTFTERDIRFGLHGWPRIKLTVDGR